MAIDISDGQQDAKKMKAKVHEPPSILHKAVIQNTDAVGRVSRCTLLKNVGEFQGQLEAR